LPQCPVEKVLKEQKALVTGANSGIGKAIATALGQAGADVVVNYVRGDEQADEVVKDIHCCGSRAYAHGADVSSEDQVKAMFRKMFDKFGTIDILINNAGLLRDAPFEEMTLDQWNLVIGEPEDIGRAAVWLASDYSDYITGTSLFVDGGMTLYPGFEEGG
jgi:glucose 1-dehydrogenase